MGHKSDPGGWPPFQPGLLRTPDMSCPARSDNQNISGMPPFQPGVLQAPCHGGPAVSLASASASSPTPNSHGVDSQAPPLPHSTQTNSASQSSYQDQTPASGRPSHQGYLPHRPQRQGPAPGQPFGRVHLQNYNQPRDYPQPFPWAQPTHGLHLWHGKTPTGSHFSPYDHAAYLKHQVHTTSQNGQGNGGPFAGEGTFTQSATPSPVPQRPSHLPTYTGVGSPVQRGASPNSAPFASSSSSLYLSTPSNSTTTAPSQSEVKVTASKSTARDSSYLHDDTNMEGMEIVGRRQRRKESVAQHQAAQMETASIPGFKQEAGARNVLTAPPPKERTSAVEKDTLKPVPRKYLTAKPVAQKTSTAASCAMTTAIAAEALSLARLMRPSRSPATPRSSSRPNATAKAVRNPSEQQPAAEQHIRQGEDAAELGVLHKNSAHPDAAGASDSDLTEEDEPVSDIEPERLVTPQPGDGIDFKDKYAFNFTRTGYHHRIPEQLTTGITIKVLRLAGQSVLFDKHRKVQNNLGVSDADMAPPVMPKMNELEGSGGIDCIWVGMLPSLGVLTQAGLLDNDPADNDAGEGSSKKPAAKKRPGRPVPGAISALGEGRFKAIEFDRNALRVVAKKMDKTTKAGDVHIYALVKNPGGYSRCWGYKVAWDDVFFFREFRDDSIKMLMSRKKATIAKVKALALPDAAVADASSVSPPPPSNGGFSARKILLSAASMGKGESSRKQATKASSPSSSAAATPTHKPSQSQRPSSASATALKSWENATPTAESKPSFKFKSTKAAKKVTKWEEINAGKRKAEDVGPLDGKDTRTKDSRKKAKIDASVQKSAASDDRHTSSGAGKKAGGKAENLVGLVTPTTDYYYAAKSKDTDDDDDEDAEQVQRSSSADHSKTPGLERLTKLVLELAAEGDEVLQQGITIVESLLNRRDPRRSSALSLCLNIPGGMNVEMDDCDKQLKQLKALFPTLADDDTIQPDALAWMAKGLQGTGQTLSMDLLGPCFIAFAALFRAHQDSDGAEKRLTRTMLTDMTIMARNEAEERVWLEHRAARAESRRRLHRRRQRLVGGDDGSGDEDDDCHSHVVSDESDEELFSFGAAVWTDPRDRSESKSGQEEDWL